MRVVVDVATNKILQVEKSPPIGEANPFNGRYAVPIPDGASVDVDSSTYILPQDGGDLAAACAAALLARFPMYSHIVYNYLLEAADVAELDLTATGPTGEITRAVTGRGVAPGVFGQAPNSTAVSPVNNAAAPPRPGCLVTAMIDIGPMTGGAGADEFLAWWYFYDFSTGDDVVSSYGATVGQNDPATKSISEMDQEPTSLDAYISHDNGATWTAIGRLEPTDLVTFDTDVRLCFINNGSAPLYLAAYAILF